MVWKSRERNGERGEIRWRGGILIFLPRRNARWKEEREVGMGEREEWGERGMKRGYRGGGWEGGD